MSSKKTRKASSFRSEISNFIGDNRSEAPKKVEEEGKQLAEQLDVTQYLSFRLQEF